MAGFELVELLVGHTGVCANALRQWSRGKAAENFIVE